MTAAHHPTPLPAALGGNGPRAVHCSLDPSTCLVEAAVHRGFAVPDTQPHVLSCLRLHPPAR